MCAVIGTYLKNASARDVETLEYLFLESGIRGRHATGVSYVKNWKIHTIKEPVPVAEFLKNHDVEEFRNEDGGFYLIGHCRYSTSDLEYNQPLVYRDCTAIVHNGVMSQELPENWPKIYGSIGKCKTKNDSELLLNTIVQDADPLTYWNSSKRTIASENYDCSMAVCELRSNKTLRAWRNGKRPLYISYMKNGYIFTSTKDIASRCGLDGTLLDMYSYYKIQDNVFSVQDMGTEGLEDLQNVS